MKKTLRFLIVDDEPDLADLLAQHLARKNYPEAQFDCATTLAQAEQFLAQSAYDLCITDLALIPPNGREGLELLRYIRQYHDKTTVIVITGHGDMQSAIDAFRLGAFDYVTRPVELKKLEQTIKNALDGQLVLHTQDRQNMVKLIGESPVIQQLRKKIAKISKTDAPVYIYGESGTGKEVVARLIHQSSSRANNPFVAINCGAIPGELMESEFFGHKKGSFTGAYNNKLGFFETARGGVLFLDEISELHLNMQTKLLRTLQEKTMWPVGATKEVDTDVRIISASNKRLADLVQNGKFREDLYFRICVFDLCLPPLRERGNDILLLAEHTINRLSPKRKMRFSNAALNAIEDYHFPGNVRELENLLESAIAMAEADIIDVQHLDFKKLNINTEEKTALSIEQIRERKIMLNALQETGGRKRKAAELLGWTWGRFRYRARLYNIDDI
jgi:two-component system, NtrC family, response regulator PilR